MDLAEGVRPAGGVQLSSSERHETLQILNEELKYRLAIQREAIDRTDTKATLLAGFVVAGSQLLVSNRSKLGAAWLTAALVASAIALGAAVLAIRLRPYFDAPKADALVAKYGEAWPEKLLGALIGTRMMAVERNSKGHRRRVLLWWVSLAFLVMSIALTTVGFLRGSK